MHGRNPWCRRGVLAVVCVLGILAMPAWGDPHFAIRTPWDWEMALANNYVRMCEPYEWQQYMDQWRDYLVEGEPYPATTFVWPELYVSYETGGGGGGGGGLVMLWGDPGAGMTDGPYASAWKHDYQVDPDLSNSMISLSVFAPMARPNPSGIVRITQISFGIQDINGNTRSWYWNVGPGTKVPWNVLKRFTIDCSQTGVNATTPPADSYMSHPLFNIAQSQWFIADENGLLVGGALAIPPPPTPHPGIWNLWHDILVMPRWEYKWQQPPDPAEPNDLYLGWNEPSDYWNGPIVADDWVCTTTDPVTDVHWWGSFIGWNESSVPQLPNHFHIGIWSDIPAIPGDPNSFSHPGSMIQEFLAYPTSPGFTVTFVGRDFDPRTNQFESCFRFDYDFPAGEQFEQPGGQNIYWVSIAACEGGGTALPYPFGWKTRPRSPTSLAPDDAVVMTNPVQPVPGMGYIDGYPLWFPTPQDSWDMAFELTSKIEGTKIWEQPPDLTPEGMAVNATKTRVAPTTPYTLADDFQCVQTGPITQILVFGSWWHDIVPNLAQVSFRLSLHSDVPGDPNNPLVYSHPGALLWFRNFTPGTYQYDQVASGLQEGWYDPNSPTYEPIGDTVCWRFTFNLDPNDPNTPIQQGTPDNPVTYWLDVRASTPATPVNYFGWKTSPAHWNDAAVWAYGTNPAPTAWRMLTYPPMHPFEGDQIDLAFQIIGPGQLPQQTTKWSQPPEPYHPVDAFNGWDQYSVYDSTGIVADDWVCTSWDPVSDIHWWGSFIGWDDPWPSQLPDAFFIRIWSDWPKDPLDPNSFSHPWFVLWENWCTTYEWGFAGWDFDPRVSIPGAQAPPEATFEFTQHLDREHYFPQEPNTIYWVSIAAVYSSGVDPPNPFGWKTRPRDLTSLAPDDAVVIYDPTGQGNWEYVSGAPIEYPAGTSWDMAFEISTTKVDRVVCEPAGHPNPFHPPTYWYDVTPATPRYDFHVRVGDKNPANYTNVIAPVGWLFSVHQAPSDGLWWASWYDPTCTNPITATFRFQFDNPSPRDWDIWTTTTSCTDNPYSGIADAWWYHSGQPAGYGSWVHVPKPYSDVVVCEPQGSVGNPFHPPTYWYDVTPDRFGRCDFHVRVYDPNPVLYTNPSLPASTWQFAVHQLPNGEWWASWWDPNCTNAIYTTFRFQFDHRNPSVWGVWTTTTSGTDDPNNQVVDLAANHATEPDGSGYRVHVPRALSDVVVCEPQGPNNPVHPVTYWYDVTPDYLGRCDFHVRVYDTNPANYTNVSLPAATWQFAVHQIPSGEWYASWWDPNCTNAIFATFRFQFDNPNASTWDHWTTTISGTNDPFNDVIDRSENHATQTDGYGYRVHVPLEATEACCMSDASCLMYTPVDCILAGGVPQGVGTNCDPPFVCPWHKWSQPPTSNMIQWPLFYGWDDPSTYYGPVVADDWQCVDQRPVTDIHWWGSYRYWDIALPPPTAPQAFHIGIWTDVPIGPNNPVSWSHPNRMFHEYFVLRSDLNERAVGMDQHPQYGRETCFQYDLKLAQDDWFWQGVRYNIFWISISAVYGSPCNGDFDHDGDVDTDDVNFFNACLMGPPVPACWQADLNGDGLVDFNDVPIMQCQQAAGWPDPACCQFTPVPPENVWGWKTRLPHWNDDAVRIFQALPPRMRAGWEFRLGEPIEDQMGESWDTSFVLTTRFQPPPPPCTGDTNCDGVISYGDINPFVIALNSASLYQQQYPSCRYLNADCNGDGFVTYADINPFVILLNTHPPCP